MFQPLYLNIFSCFQYTGSEHHDLSPAVPSQPNQIQSTALKLILLLSVLVVSNYFITLLHNNAICIPCITLTLHIHQPTQRNDWRQQTPPIHW